MATSIDAISDVAAAFLAAALDALNFTDTGPPARAYLSAGEPSIDCCDELAVWTPSLVEAGLFAGSGALSGARKLARGEQPVLTVMVRATRCGPEPTTSGSRIILPSPDALTAAADTVMQDMWALWNHLSWELRHGNLAQICSGAWRDGVRELQPQGTCIGCELTFRYPIQGGPLGT